MFAAMQFVVTYKYRRRGCWCSRTCQCRTLSKRHLS